MDWKGGFIMKGKRYKAAEIINKLREVEVEMSKGLNAAEGSRKAGISEQTYYRWRKEYGGMKFDQVKRLKELEKENARLKKLVADLSLDKAMLKEIAEGNF